MPLAKVDDIELYYELDGPPRGRPLVFVNGLLTDTRSWAPQVAFFKGEFRVLTYDARGQGRSEKPPGPYPIALHARDLAGLLDLLQIRRAACVGLSNGGAALLALAIERPDLVDRLVVADGYSHVDALLRAKLDAWVKGARVSSELRFDIATPYVWSNRFLERCGEAFDAYRQKASAFPKEAAVALIEGAKLHQVSERLSEIRARTLIVVGEEDILTPVPHARFIRQRIAGAELCIIPEAGHAAPIEQPDLFNRAVKKFLQEG